MRLARKLRDIKRLYTDNHQAKYHRPRELELRPHQNPSCLTLTDRPHLSLDYTIGHNSAD